MRRFCYFVMYLLQFLSQYSNTMKHHYKHQEKRKVAKTRGLFYTALYLLLGIGLLNSSVCEAAPSAKDTKKQIETIERKISRSEKKIKNYEAQIELNKLKIELHNDCRSCSANCKTQFKTTENSFNGKRGCKHWSAGTFRGKRVRICHQLPDGNQRYAGIDQAISVLETRNEALENTINNIKAQIAELEGKLDALQSATNPVDTVTEDVVREVEDF